MRAQFVITLGISSITIVTVDNEISILTLFYNLDLETQIVLQFVSVSTIRYLDISATTLLEGLRQAIPGFHAFASYDLTTQVFEDSRI